MSWAGYKKLYPNGTVFYNEFETPIEKLLCQMLSLDDTWYGDKWMFKTVNLNDTRLHSKEHVIGLKGANEQLALTKPYIKKKKILNLKVGDRYIALAYFPEYDAITAFNRFKDGKELNIDTIYIQGNTPQYGKLEREFIYNSILWAVWAHYYPNTKLME